MKKILISALTIFITALCFGQSRYIFIEFKDVQKPAIINELPFPEKTVSDAIKNKLEKAGYSSKETKGFDVYRGVKMPEIGPDNYDLYFKVDRKSKKDKEASVVTMMVSKGLENFISEADDATVISKAKAWLDSLQTTAIAYDLELQIKEQENLVMKAEKKYRNLVNDGDDMRQKKKKLEQQIEDTDKQLMEQKNEIDKQTQIFTTLKEKRKS